MAFRLSTRINRQLVDIARRHFSAKHGAEQEYINKMLLGESVRTQLTTAPSPASLFTSQASCMIPARNKEDFANLIARKISDLQQMKSLILPGYYTRPFDAVAKAETAKANKPEMKARATQVNFKELKISPINIPKPKVSQSIRNYVTIHYRKPRFNDQFLLKLRRRKKFIRPKKIVIMRPKARTMFSDSTAPRIVKGRRYFREPLASEYYRSQRVLSPYPSFSELRREEFTDKYDANGYSIEVPFFKQPTQRLHSSPKFYAGSDEKDNSKSGTMKKRPCKYIEPVSDYDAPSDNPDSKKKRKKPDKKSPRSKKTSDASQLPLMLLDRDVEDLQRIAKELQSMRDSTCSVNGKIEDWMGKVGSCPETQLGL